MLLPACLPVCIWLQTEVRLTHLSPPVSDMTMAPNVLPRKAGPVFWNVPGLAYLCPHEHHEVAIQTYRQL